MSQQLVLEVVRLKISKDVWRTSKSRRIVAFMEAMYHNHIVKSTDSKVYEGSTYALPWDDKLKKVQVNFFFIDDLLTMDIGTALYMVSEDSKFSSDGSTTEVTLKIYPSGGTVPVGRAYVRVHVQELFDDKVTVPRKAKPVPQTDHAFAVPDFRFKRLSRVLHWERIRSMNLSQTVQNSDVRTLLTCLDDVTTGDVSQEDIDPALYKALQLAQYGSQYLLSCRKVMKDRETVLKTALKTFQEEEELLDLKLAKMRARDKALKREARDLDDLTVEYSSALRDLNPKLMNDLYRTYQKKLRPRQKEPSRGAGRGNDAWAEEEDVGEGEQWRREEHRRGRPVRPHVDPWDDQGHSQQRAFEYEGEHRPQRQEGAERSEGRAGARPGAAEEPDGWAKPRSQPQGATTAAWETQRARSPRIKEAGGDPWRTSAAAGNEHRTAGPAAVKVVPVRVAGGRASSSDVGSDSDTRSEESAEKAAEDRVVGFVQPPPVTVAPVLRTIAARTVTVNADGIGRRNESPAPAEDAREFAAPVLSKSVDIASASGGWAAASATRPPIGSSQVAAHARDAPPLVQQSIGDASVATTAMSVDSLTMPPLARNPSAPTFTLTTPITPITPLTPNVQFELTPSNTASYEGVDMSEFVLRTEEKSPRISYGASGTVRDSGGISERSSRDLYGDEESYSEDEDHAENEQPPRDIAAAGDESMQLEEFDDSVHMDHHPVKVSKSTVQSGGGGEVSQVSGAHAVAAKVPPLMVAPLSAGKPMLAPLSATKRTPQRADRGRGERDAHSSEEYSMDGDSPFQNLSVGGLSASKDYNQILGRRNNTSHISSNGTGFNQSGASANSSYDMSAFEDEDDPFGRPGTAPNLNLTQISGASDIDQSKSIMIDFMLPSESKEQGRQAGSRDYKDTSYDRAEEKMSYRGASGSSGGAGDKRYIEEDISGDMDLFSPVGGGARGGYRNAADEDDVLMGTTKISFGSTRDFGNTGRTGMGNTLPSTGQLSEFSRDSLGSGARSTSGGSTPMLVPGTAQTPGALVGSDRRAAPFSPVHEHGAAQDASLTEDESIPPPTYDALLGTGGATEDSIRASSISMQQSVQDSAEGSSFFETSAAEPQHIRNIEPEADSRDMPQWTLGRAGMESIEMAAALEVYVNAVRLDDQHARIYSQVQVKVEFLGVQSDVSDVVKIGRADTVQPVNFSAHMLFSAAQEEVLMEEIAELDDAIALQVHVVDADTQEVVGSANVELWTMVEDGVNMLRKEVEILNLDMSSEMGIVLLDAKGFRLLKKCAAALRNRRRR